MTRADQSSAPDDADSHAVLHKFAPLLSLLREKMLALPPYMTQAPTSSSSTHTSTSGSTAAKTRQDQSQSASAEEKYVEELRPHAFRMVQMDYSSHLYKRYIDESANANVSRQRMSRILKEVASLTTSMPVHFASSICVRVDETRPDVIKAMITGPEDTPYANGCFIFDIFLPQQYPAVPPMVSLITTDGGRVRFGPNLYNTGKVCLSLLGTWSGPGWDPKVCTVLQVLVSIQSLILNEQPFFNEPGYEFSTQTPDSELYNTCVSYQALFS
ncbi:hypothetical protein PTSG_03406 [Salpingoeca rosetta]|uniref:UBC core domain-containing protein n=1 Tax=Salpingoeca rosetta (strain ATCC 50818 / BSB-021) TaxID=946362 RepID=F2U539_SALR5|nr:uncharacterized protein PTSG_03406 [Salpingoeca rosetta]EGD82755.1 hypothetical protein PTSG_03406 [Salpingoeca rosetta]|eukprot:XP_004995991.1 hypothetical protein PTSG_03406 [Salpingoeca rosetta]